MPLQNSMPWGSLQSSLAVDRLRRREIYCAASVDVTDPGDHNLIGGTADLFYIVVVGIRHRAGATRVLRPVDARLDIVAPSGRPAIWMVLDVPAARVPAGLAWSQLGRSGQVDYAAPTIAIPVARNPSKSLDTILCSHFTPALTGTYRSNSLDGCQVLSPGRALLLIAGRWTGGQTHVEGELRVEVCDE